MLKILYQDDDFIAINKPNGILVHRTKIAQDTEGFALQLLRNQIKQRVYPIHRLDKPTSGVLLFGLHSEAAKQMVTAFTNRTIEKQYWAIVRGYTEKEAVIDYALQIDKYKPRKQAITEYKTIQKIEIPQPIGRYKTARYSWIEATPKTGRMHQLRKHFKHIFHPIIGDRKYGDRDHNRYFREELGYTSLFLLARSLKFVHPFSKETITITAPLSEEMAQVFQSFNWETSV